MLKPLKSVGEAWPFVAQSSLCQVDQAEKLFIFLEKSCVLWNLPLGMHARPPWESAVCWRRPPGWILCFEAITSRPFTLPHSFRSLQSILGLADSTPFFAVKEGHEYPPVLWLKSLCSGGHLKQPWLPTFFIFFFFICPKSLFQSFLLASYLCTVWLADPNVLCVLEPDSKKKGPLQHQWTYRGTAKGLWGKKSSEKQGVMERWKLEHSVKRIWSKDIVIMCHSGLSVHPSIPTVLRPAQEIIQRPGQTGWK